MKIKVHILLSLLTLHFCQAQDSLSLKPQVELKAGFRWQSTLMNFLNFDPISRNSFIPYNYERNMQGIGGSLGARIYFPKHNFGLEYTLTFRYDYLH
jgi:hypothetical protein